MRSMEIKHEQQMKELREEMKKEREEMKKELEAANVNKDRGYGKVHVVTGYKEEWKSKHNHYNKELNAIGSTKGGPDRMNEIPGDILKYGYGTVVYTVIVRLLEMRVFWIPWL